MAETTHFGERTVPLEEKQALVDKVFHDVADRYDLMNDLMSGGVHRLWKDAMVARLAPPKTGSVPYRVLDMAGGTGDIAERILNASVGYAEVTVSDINSDMLRVGAERAKDWRFGTQAKFVEANAEELPFEDETFDAYTIAFGIRNVPRIDKALSEAFRVLKRGGRFLVLDNGTNRLVDSAQIDDYRPILTFTAGQRFTHGYRRNAVTAPMILASAPVPTIAASATVAGMPSTPYPTR